MLEGKKKIFLLMIFCMLLTSGLSSGGIFDPLLVVISDPLTGDAGDEVTFTVTANLLAVEGVTVKSDGTTIGTTDSNGEVDHIFEEGGEYSITAEKSGYNDAISYLMIINDIEIPSLLVLTADSYIIDTGGDVTFSVLADFEAVEGVSIKIDGVSIGTTDSNGEIVHTFDDGGKFTINAEKDGYLDAIPIVLNVVPPVVDILEFITIEGALLTMPISLEVIAMEYFKENVLDLNLPLPLSILMSADNTLSEYLLSLLPEAKLLITDDRFYLIFTDEDIENGYANITGVNIVNLSWAGKEVGMILSSDLSVSTVVEEVSFDELISNPASYENKLVRVEATARRYPFLIDVPNVELSYPVTIGRLVKDPINPLDLSNFVDNSYKLISACEDGCDREELEDILNIESESLATFGFESGYIIDSEATVDAIVLYSSMLDTYFDELLGEEVTDFIIPAGYNILLYTLNTELIKEDVTINDIVSDPDLYSGKVVSFLGSDLGVSIKAKEVLKKIAYVGGAIVVSIFSAGTGAAVGGEVAEIIVEQIPLDLILHGNIILTQPFPTSLTDLPTSFLLSVSVSNYAQNNIIDIKHSNFDKIRYTGKIFTTKEINESLESLGTYVFVLYETEVDGNILEDLVSEVLNNVVDKIDYIQSVFEKLNPEKIIVDTISPGNPGNFEVDIEEIENIIITTLNSVESAGITIIKSEYIPGDIDEEVSGEVFLYLDINLENIDEEDLDSITINFNVDKSWINQEKIEKSSITLYHYKEGSWVALSTTEVGETDSEYIFSAVTSSLSTFAVSGNPEEVITPNDKSGDSGSPGFETILLLIAIISIVIFLNKKHN